MIICCFITQIVYISTWYRCLIEREYFLIPIFNSQVTKHLRRRQRPTTDQCTRLWHFNLHIYHISDVSQGGIYSVFMLLGSHGAESDITVLVGLGLGV